MSSHLPVISGRDAARAFARIGYQLRPGRGKGSHMVLHDPNSGRILTVPDHNPVRRGTLRALIRQAGITVEQFRSLL